MNTHTNVLRERLEQGLPTVATRILSVWPVIAEAAATTGHFDYLEFVGEYAPFTQSDLENLARAMELHHVGSMIKVDFQNRAYVAQRAMSAGFQAVLLTDHTSAKEVRESVWLLSPDTPQDGGRMGYPNRRWIGYNPNLPQQEYASMVRRTVIAVMIEKHAAIEAIEDICAVQGVDMVQFGPSDYALSRGWNLAEHRDEVRAAERRMIEVALAHGVAPRCEINYPDEAQYYIELGVRHFCIGDELRNNMTYWSANGSTMRELTDVLEDRK